MPESSRVDGRPRMPKGKNVDWGKAISWWSTVRGMQHRMVLGSDQGSKFDGVAVVSSIAVMLELPKGIAKKMKWR
ncbi:MAG: hypothetical protein N2V77_02260 [Canidatus Methanoxibalbensis ujae]|nr:hypothetical protein [Candidatus Methanoxibalbensis ujae]MCW7078492.1 hypothetical protein [Candidatus Methanoxibalbensis ujae]